MAKEREELAKTCKQLSEAVLKLTTSTPEDFKLEEWIENGEVVIKIKY